MHSLILSLSKDHTCQRRLSNPAAAGTAEAEARRAEKWSTTQQRLPNTNDGCHRIGDRINESSLDYTQPSFDNSFRRRQSVDS